MINRVKNSISLNENSIWVPENSKQFNYSDGRASEKYLQKVFNEAGDLSSTSFELEGYIKDWPSEYHLTRKRTQLLRGFDFDKTKKVLEVGSGCGAITRFLGETFDDVIGVEGSLARATIARQRTQELDNVSILCAPFQEVEFVDKFDLIFCIGVFEYSDQFIAGDDPYDAALKYFKDLLTPDGTVVIAIENQFGLKYFSSSKEDHSGKMFDGIEGYRHGKIKARTFGYQELDQRLKKHFSNTDFYYPYPDYKIPTCILSEKFFDKVQADELVGSIKSRDYSGATKSLFDEYYFALELGKNNMLPFFANSFLVFASNNVISLLPEGKLGWLYSSDRKAEFQTVTQFVEQKDGSLWSKKSLKNGNESTSAELLTLKGSTSKWMDGKSVHSMIRCRANDQSISIGALIAPAMPWLETLKQLSTTENNRLMLDGQYFDHVWQNTYIENGKCHFIDNEWNWDEQVSLNLVVIRSMYLFIRDIAGRDKLHPALAPSSSRAVITCLANNLGVKLKRADFNEFVRFEAELRHLISGTRPLRKISSIKLFLSNRRLLAKIESTNEWIATFRRKANSTLIKLFELQKR